MTANAMVVTGSDRQAWAAAGRGLELVYKATGARILVALVGVALGFIIRPSGDDIARPIIDWALVLGGLVATGVLVYGLARYTRVPAESGARGAAWVAAAAAAGGLAAAVVALAVELASVVLPASIAMGLALGSIGLTLAGMLALLVSLRQAARAVGADDLAGRATRAAVLLGLAVLTTLPPVLRLVPPGELTQAVALLAVVFMLGAFGMLLHTMHKMVKVLAAEPAQR